jgi:putative DNA primase/helicase
MRSRLNAADRLRLKWVRALGPVNPFDRPAVERWAASLRYVLAPGDLSGVLCGQVREATDPNAPERDSLDAFDTLTGGGTLIPLPDPDPRATGSGRSAGKPPRKRAERHLVMTPYSEIAPREIEWLWDQRIAVGHLTLFSGDPGSAKSFLMSSLAAHVSAGAAWPDTPLFPQPRGSVVYLSAEDDPNDTTVHRLAASGADLSRVFHVQGSRVRVEGEGPDGDVPPSPFSLRADLPLLERTIDAVDNVRLLIIDPITSYLDGVPEEKNAEVKQLVLQPLRDLAARRRLAVCLVNHLTKGGGAKALYRSGGGIAFQANARISWLVKIDPREPSGKRRLLLPVKDNIAPGAVGMAFTIDRGAVLWEGEPVSMRADDLLRSERDDDEPKRGRPAGQAHAAMNWLAARLAEGPRPKAEVLRAAAEDGISRATLARAAAELGVRTGGKRGLGELRLPLDPEEGEAP